MSDVVVWVPVLVLAVGALVVALVATVAVLLVGVSVVCAGPRERGRAAVAGARELRRLVEALLRGWPGS